jgi:nitrogen regulatory protein P-II 1
MKEIKAIIQPFMLNHVLDDLYQIEGVTGVMSSEVRCTSATRGNLNPDVNTKLELMVPDGLVERVLDAIQTHAHTGKPGDGRIFVIPIEQAVRIKTGERSWGAPDQTPDQTSIQPGAMP